MRGLIKAFLLLPQIMAPDSYDFAKDKPITLLNGGELIIYVRKAWDEGDHRHKGSQS